MPTLRIDLEGLGDSDGDSSPLRRHRGAVHARPRRPGARGDGRARGSRARGARFLLAGLCAGAYWSFHAALRDPPVLTTFLLNPRALIWDESLDRERDARKIGGALQRLVLAPGAPRQGLAGPDAHDRARGRRGAVSRPGRRGRSGATAAASSIDALVRLRESGTRLLLVFGGNEPLHEELEREGRLSQLDQWPNMQLELLPGNDHSFRPIRSQHYVHAVLERALDRELARPRSAARRSRAEPWATYVPLVDGTELPRQLHPTPDAVT